MPDEHRRHDRQPTDPIAAPSGHPPGDGGAWCWFLAIALIATVAYFLLPRPAQDWWYLGFAAAGVGAVVAGIRRHRAQGAPGDPWPWWLLAVGLALFVAGDGVWTFYELGLGSEVPFPSIADILYLAGYPFLLVALLRLPRARGERLDYGSLIDAMILATGAGAVAWVLLMAPYANDGTLSLAGRLVTIAYPLMDVLLLGVAVRLFLDARARVRADRLLGLGLGAMLAADVLFAAAELWGSYASGDLIDAGWLFSYALLGAAALHPARGIAAPAVSAPQGPPTAGPTRRLLAVMAAVAAVPAVVLVVEALLGTPRDLPVVAGATAVLIVLVLVRIFGLVRGLESALADRRRAEATLAEERDLLRQLIDTLPHLIFVKDTSSRFVRINRALATLWGMADPGHAVGRTDFDFVAEEVARAYVADDRRIVAEGASIIDQVEPIGLEHEESRWLSTTKVPALDAAGRVAGVIGIARDITEIKRAEDALRRSEERLRLALAAAKMASWDWDLVADRLDWSGELAMVYGLPPDHPPLDYEGHMALVHPDDREELRAIDQRLLAAGAEFEIEYRWVCPDGRVRWLREVGEVVRDAAGRAVRRVGVTADVTERKATEEDLRRREARHRALLDAIPDQMIRFDRRGTCLDHKAAHDRDATALLEDYVGRSLTELVASPLAEQWLDTIERVLATGSMEVLEYQRGLFDGLRYREARLVAAGPDEVVAVVRDVTERKRAEEALRRSEARLAEAQRLAHLGSWELDLATGEVDLVGRELPHLRPLPRDGSDDRGAVFGVGPPRRPQGAARPDRGGKRARRRLRLGGADRAAGWRGTRHPRPR